MTGAKEAFLEILNQSGISASDAIFALFEHLTEEERARFANDVAPWLERAAETVGNAGAPGAPPPVPPWPGLFISPESAQAAPSAAPVVETATVVVVGEHITVTTNAKDQHDALHLLLLGAQELTSLLSEKKLQESSHGGGIFGDSGAPQREPIP